MSIIKLNQGYSLLVKHRLLAPTLARKFDISHWFPRDTDGLGMYGHVITKISRMAGSFRCGGRTRGAPLLSVFLNSVQ